MARRRGWTGCLLLLFGTAATALAQQGTDPFASAAQRLVQAINAQDHTAVRQDFSQAMLNDLTVEKSKTFFASVVKEFGRIERLEPPRRPVPGRAVFLARAARGDLDITIVLDKDDKIAGLTIVPRPRVPEKLVTSLRLPFDDRWLVTAGGDSRELNHHHDSLSQRFAFDFVAVDKQGREHSGKGMANEDYYAFGRPVLAPADGVVTDVIRGVRDNVPGSMNPFFAPGNAVILRHREGEFSVLAHFQQGSIRVKPGERVRQGQVLGLCGNSGNSSGPHIHFHVQNTPIFQEAAGLRCTFDKLTVNRDGKTDSKTSYSPVKGDVVCPQ